jgi:hypothetical protein
MILVDKTFEVVTHESAEHGEVEDAGFSAVNEGVTFRELVEMMRREYTHPSMSPVHRSTRVWFTNEPEEDYRTGEYRSESIHFSHDNPARKTKYWIKAMRCAGYRFANHFNG